LPSSETESFRANYERLVERAELVEDVRLAEAQLELGEGVQHRAAKEHILKRLRA